MTGTFSPALRQDMLVIVRDFQSTNRTANRKLSAKSSHVHSNSESDNTLSQHRISEYVKSSSHSNMYHIHNNGTNANAREVYHQSRTAQTLADFVEHFEQQP
ncbi:hypothetical protein CTAM01_14803 [Colletotrichum tamarilloi]|uniref:Uncharacterized protein n=1 Tax=Colletotrichum tamarilloi TaxID=1209934 RepID=A0ABQ9QN53_9PEZI|nr:uncharacterized protein CTAM01_14803 [Colletotrichum tamarilloi]KAK1479148.1 hypothetical protein CTAM01_14803 [Colletotrichum tamarilloi]